MTGSELPPTGRLLFVTAAPESGRNRRLSALLAQSFALETATDFRLDPRLFDAVVLDGAADGPEPRFLALLEQTARQGAPVLTLVPPRPLHPAVAEWLGVDAGEAHRLGEWFLSPNPASALTARMPDEFAVVDAPVELAVTSPGYEAVLSVSVGFKDRVVMARRPQGQGWLIAVGLATSERGLSSEETARVLSRSLRCPAERTRQIGLAVLGYGPYGGMGLYHGRAAGATDGLEMVASADPDPARREAAEREFPGSRAYGGVEGLERAAEVDLVVVATPPVSHFELARRLLEAGKHVVLEKPMCLKVAEADELIRLAARGQRLLTVHQSRRWDPDFRLLARKVSEGSIGELFNVETFVGGFEHPCRAWHSEVEVSGGAVYDWGSHHLDWILQLMGDFPSELIAHGHKRVWRDVTNLDQVRVRLTWSDGREAEFLQSDVAAIRRPKFFLQGTLGTIAGHYRPLVFERLEPGYGYVGEPAHHAEAPVELTLARYEEGAGLSETVLKPGAPERYGFHRNLADHLLSGEALAVTAESARQVVALLEAAQISTDKGNVAVQLKRPGS